MAKELKAAVQRFLDWKDKNEVEFLVSEQMVYSKKYDYVGTMDFILAEWAMKNQEFPLEDMKNKISDILQFGLMKRGEK